jgi:uncharacterized coiled-coil protein SlyX
MGLPVAQLDYHNCPHYVQTGWDIAAAEHIGPAVRSMASNDPVRLQFQSEQLSDSLLGESVATERMKTLIQRMSEIAGQQVQAGQPVEFPPNLLMVPTIRLNNFDHATIFDREAFKQSDKTILQAQLAHSRREVTHLQRQVEQLQNELNQAHQIFETINAHPIAGPVIRIRQKMLDLMARIRSHKQPNSASGPAPIPFQTPTENQSEK